MDGLERAVGGAWAELGKHLEQPIGVSLTFGRLREFAVSSAHFAPGLSGT